MTEKEEVIQKLEAVTTECWGKMPPFYVPYIKNLCKQAAELIKEQKNDY